MRLKRIIFTLIIFSIFILIFTNINNEFGIYPSSSYLKHCAIMSIQQSNNYFWETYTGKEGEEFFTDKMKNKYFDKAVDLKYIQDMKIVSKGNIEKFTNINASIPSISFITYREITDKNTTTKFRTEMTYKFTFTGYHWLIDNVTFERL